MQRFDVGRGEVDRLQPAAAEHAGRGVDRHIVDAAGVMHRQRVVAAAGRGDRERVPVGRVQHRRGRADLDRGRVRAGRSDTDRLRAAAVNDVDRVGGRSHVVRQVGNLDAGQRHGSQPAAADRRRGDPQRSGDDRTIRGQRSDVRSRRVAAVEHDAGVGVARRHREGIVASQAVEDQVRDVVGIDRGPAGEGHIAAVVATGSRRHVEVVTRRRAVDRQRAAAVDRDRVGAVEAVVSDREAAGGEQPFVGRRAGRERVGRRAAGRQRRRNSRDRRDRRETRVGDRRWTGPGDRSRADVDRQRSPRAGDGQRVGVARVAAVDRENAAEAVGRRSDADRVRSSARIDRDRGLVVEVERFEVVDRDPAVVGNGRGGVGDRIGGIGRVHGQRTSNTIHDRFEAGEEDGLGRAAACMHDRTFVRIRPDVVRCNRVGDCVAVSQPQRVRAASAVEDDPVGQRHQRRRRTGSLVDRQSIVPAVAVDRQPFDAGKVKRQPHDAVLGKFDLRAGSALSDRDRIRAAAADEYQLVGPAAAGIDGQLRD